jgi:hypothetical protein
MINSGDKSTVKKKSIKLILKGGSSLSNTKLSSVSLLKSFMNKYTLFVDYYCLTGLHPDLQRLVRREPRRPPNLRVKLCNQELITDYFRYKGR